MACRIGKSFFEGMVRAEAASLGLKHVEIDQADPVENFNMVEVDCEQTKGR